MGVQPLKVAVIGSGISGLSCAWLLQGRHAVTVYEADSRIGGHSHTVDAPAAPASGAEMGGGAVPVDTGFIVYNEANYPNLTALFRHLGVVTQHAEMSFGVSLDGGALEYGSANPGALLAQPSNLFKPRFWSMIKDLVRFYRAAPQALAALEREPLTLGDLLDRGGYGEAFQHDHLLPQVGAIWSTSPVGARDYPAAALIRFFTNHGLLNLMTRPQWRTVAGGSRAYLAKLTADFAHCIRRDAAVVQVRRLEAGRMDAGGVEVRDVHGHVDRFDRVVIATHADQALRLLQAPTAREQAILGAFRYSSNLAVLHSDPDLMPRRRAAWSGWNHIGRRDEPDGFCVTYWMNLLQTLPRRHNLFVTLNPRRTPDPAKVIGSYTYDHPLFDTAALNAQRRLWSLQGVGGIWYCGAHFGAGFHEDGLQSGLAAAEHLTKDQPTPVRRPWSVADESGRIHITPIADPVEGLAA